MDCSVAQTTCGSNMQLHFDGLLMDRMMKLASNRRSWDINFPLEITCPHASFAVGTYAHLIRLSAKSENGWKSLENWL